MTMVPHNPDKLLSLKSWTPKQWTEAIILKVNPIDSFNFQSIMKQIFKKQLDINIDIDNMTFEPFYQIHITRETVEGVRYFLKQANLIIAHNDGNYSLSHKATEIKELGGFSNYETKLHRQQRAEELMIQVNESVIDTNISVQNLNNRTGDIYSFQKLTTIITCIVAVVALTASIGASYISYLNYELEKNGQKSELELLLLKKQQSAQGKVLDSLLYSKTPVSVQDSVLKK